MHGPKMTFNVEKLILKLLIIIHNKLFIFELWDRMISIRKLSSQLVIELRQFQRDLKNSLI